jgi:N-acetylmuramoyl-L-alanine amidase
MTRYDNNTNPSSDQRMKLLRDVKADYCIAIHRNASSSSAPRAFNSYHFNAFSADAAKKIYAATERADLYQKSKWSGVKWHYFYTARQTDCPVVLTENGFITNAAEYSDMIRDEFNDECAKALTQGIVDYFVSIQLTTPKPVTPEVSEPSSGVSSSEQTSSVMSE